ncbi:hypothetical protein BFJ68_g5178 [Fusarium oxysporum]|uniref:chitinase n=1 Tax=Fusarium oxysporum TaxID=5507 RepID=A0A420RHZ8_FUSOX|nr:hypothetical protein BFJ68_g5178 [Fusarium oxysporum]
MRCISWARLSGALLLGAGIVKAEFAMLSADDSLCPIPCEGTIPGDLTVYHSVDSLFHCQEPMMFDFSVMNPLDDPETIVQIRACTATKAVKPCTKHVSDAPAVEEYLNGTVVDIYIGALVDVDSSISALSDAASSSTELTKASRGIIPVRGGNRIYGYNIGLVSSGDDNLGFIQHAVKSWAKASCAPTAGASGTKTIGHLNVPTRLLDHHNSHPRRHYHPHPHGVPIPTPTHIRIPIYSIEPHAEQHVLLLATLALVSLPSAAPVHPDSLRTTATTRSCALRLWRAKLSAALLVRFLTSDQSLKPMVNVQHMTLMGWNGCKNILLGQKICTSKGSPPLPAPVSDAQCGPTKPGSKMPTGNKKLTDLNPCPLKACCNIWGQCGTTKDYCTISKSTTGNPGMSSPGENGCTSNCDMKIVNNEKAPDSFKKVAYYESWNQDRPCMHVDVRTITSAFMSGWTHVHFAFANITSDYKVSVQDTYGQFKNFKGLKGIKRIIAFGGWSFSVGVDTYTILCEAVKPANREAFANEVVRFVKDHDLDGVDFDWEYPGGSPDEPGNYLKFLQLVKSKLPSDKSLSIAAPASFWYLKQFPIAAISRTVDYIVYMTYDLHVNLTETKSSLAMVTKAGVEARKLVVGVSSYGRSFKMSSARCKGPMCTFTGPESGAAKEWADTHNVDSNTDDDEEDLEVIESCDKEYNSIDAILSSTPFKWYVDWVKEGIDAALDAFMKVKSGEGNKYIDCEWTAPNSNGSGPCTNVELRVPVNTPKAANRRFITYKMRDEEWFYEALLASHEIEKDWVEWKDNADHDICICPNGPHARDVDEKEPNRFAAGPICPCEAHAGFTMHKNYPRRIQDTSKIVVLNPKAIIEEAIPKTDDLAELLYETYMDSLNEDLDASGADAVTAFSMPVFMLEDAIKSIKSVKEIGEKQKETKTRELVLSILSIVFAVIPFAGTAASALGGAAMIARAGLIIGEAGSAALSIVDIVDDPASAPFAVLGLLIGSKGVKVKGLERPSKTQPTLDGP